MYCVFVSLFVFVFVTEQVQVHAGSHSSWLGRKIFLTQPCDGSQVAPSLTLLFPFKYIGIKKLLGLAGGTDFQAGGNTFEKPFAIDQDNDISVLDKS